MKKKINKILALFLVFMIGCIAGVLIEGIVTLLSKGHFELRQGVIYGPFAQVYGLGALVFYLVLPRIQTNAKVFVISMALRSYCGVWLLVFTRDVVWYNFMGLSQSII